MLGGINWGSPCEPFLGQKVHAMNLFKHMSVIHYPEDYPEDYPGHYRGNYPEHYPDFPG